MEYEITKWLGINESIKFNLILYKANTVLTYTMHYRIMC